MASSDCLAVIQTYRLVPTTTPLRWTFADIALSAIVTWTLWNFLVAVQESAHGPSRKWCHRDATSEMHSVADIGLLAIANR